MIDKLTNAAAAALNMGGTTGPRRKSKKAKLSAAKRVLSSAGLKAVKKYTAPARRRSTSRTRRRR